nr:MAG TPA: hypothetical protein [Caudoviricetes sp.]DAV08764.1 MAG TPA: hypothetical protein [Caudoviricetes sp.]
MGFMPSFTAKNKIINHRLRPPRTVLPTHGI